MKKQSSAGGDAVTVDGFTEKEVDMRIRKEERRIVRIKNEMENLRYDLRATRNCIDLWKSVKKELRKLNGGKVSKWRKKGVLDAVGAKITLRSTRV